jgi:competence ComEA-like helix-hairpin-helix protein
MFRRARLKFRALRPFDPTAMVSSASSPLVDPFTENESDAPSSSEVVRATDVNTASAELLRDQVPKVGAVLAGRIVDFREQHGPFTGPEDLMKVPGIGRRLADSLFPAARIAADGALSGVIDVRHTLSPPWGSPILSAEPPPPAVEENPMNTVQTEEALRASHDSEPASAPEPPLGSTFEDDERTPPVPVTTGSASLKIASIFLAVAIGLGIGTWKSTQSAKAPVRELNERVDTVRTEQERTRSDLEARTTELRATEEAVKQLAQRVDREAVERKSEHDRVTHDVAALHDTVKKSNAANEARIQRVRDALTMIELYQGARLDPNTPVKPRSGH